MNQDELKEALRKYDQIECKGHFCFFLLDSTGEKVYKEDIIQALREENERLKQQLEEARGLLQKQRDSVGAYLYTKDYQHELRPTYKKVCEYFNQAQSQGGKDAV